ncbi:ras-responsive element-binding protein 1 isoform X2 [Parasteatoda tepidariorum]|uniref:ras-responsive element-binding protein 1 isoform X2 n=1 Tax=Parasteatoda tepidariorum TaxID=114398 RepID=UPI001C71AB6F|nr:ras-responsive element-binding protein 1 isoform X2 [Parasteatoda tepidariorum]
MSRKKRRYTKSKGKDLLSVAESEKFVCDNSELLRIENAEEKTLGECALEDESTDDEKPPPSPDKRTDYKRHDALSELNSYSDDDTTSESEFQIDLSREEEEEMEEDNSSQNFCIACNLNVGTRSALTAHMKQHSITNNQTHQCLICNKTLSSASSLDRHMLIHSGERPFKCKLCDMSFTTNGNMHRHMRTHGDVETSDSEKSLDLRKKDVIKCDIPAECQDSDKKIHCPVCGKTFLCKYGLQSHMETHPNDPILCQKCDTISANYSAYINHKCNILGSKQPIKCYNLPRGFQDLTFMDFTSNKFSLVSKSYCEQNIKRPSSAFHKFECQKCSKAFPCGRALKLHEKVHETEIGTFCPSCHCDFPASPYLQLHQLKHRSVEHCFNAAFQSEMVADLKAPFNKMAAAGKEDFLALLNLQTKQSHLSLLKNLRSCHIKEDTFENYDYFVHGKVLEKDLKSDIETSKIANNNNNNDFADIQSIITVTSKAPLMTPAQTSPIAVRTISPSMFVSAHQPVSPPIAESASASPETPSKEEIPSAMDNQSMYDVSDTIMETHGVFSCKICSQRFKNSSALKRHTKLHVQRGSNYSCHICSYVSVDKSTLIRHLRTHNGERPFQCVICKYAFTTKANCERHVRKRHKKFGKAEIRNAMQYNPNMSLRTSDPSTADISNSETVCKYCGVDFKFNRVLRHHLRSLHNSCNRKPFSCKICKFGFSTKNNCIRHVLKQHPNLKDKLRSVVIPNPQMPQPVHPDSMSDSNSSVGNPPSSDHQELQPLDLHCCENPEKPLDLQTDKLSNDETVIAAEGLVSLSEAPPLQEVPLDLAAHAIDLSCKPLSAVTRKSESKPSSIFNSAPHIPFPNESLDLSQTKTPPAADTQISPLPLNASSKTKIDISPPTPGQKHRSFTCIYCNAGFTLKSNMERHIKRKHPEFARPTRSRNFIPSIVTPNMQKQNISTLSDETRNALRHHVLNTKVQQVPVYRNFHPDVPFPNVTNAFKIVGPTHSIITPVNQVPTSSTSVLNLSLDLSGKPEKITLINASGVVKTTESSDEPCSDLASVSSVICTANSPQFTQLLGKQSDSEKVDIVDKEVKKDKNEEASTFKKSDTPPVSCPFCDRQFPWTSSLRRHILTHTGQKPFKCPKCSLWFTTKSNCERHLIRKHGHKGDLITRSVPDRPYKCNHCLTSTFSTQGNLRKHFYLKHWTKSYLGMNCKPPHVERKNAESDVTAQEHSYSQPNRKGLLPCNFCDNSFGSANDLSSHMRQHSGIIYVCYLCRKTFPNHQMCYTHFKTSHSLVYLKLNLNEDVLPGSGEDAHVEENRAVADKNVSSVACMICFQKMASVEHLQKHFKTHLLKEKDDPQTIPNKNPIGRTPDPNPPKKARVIKNKVKNSLLYIFSKTANTSTQTKSPRNVGSKAEATSEEDSDLIQNLLGISDSKTIDEMLVSPDNAARILGVKEM